MKNNPLVSIVITCYNYAEYIDEAIKSVLGQTYKNIEIIVINDGSTDKSLEVIKKYSSQIHIITRQNKGIIYTRNEALKAAHGEYIIQLDADDTLESDYVKETVKTAIKEKVDIVYTDYKKFGADDSRSNFPDFSIEVLKNRNYIHMASLVKKDAIKNITFDEALSKKSHEDWDFFLALAVKRAKFIKNKNTFLQYRIHPDSRNNQQLGLTEKFNYASIYNYIIDKYKTKIPDEFEYLSGRLFADWFTYVYEEKERYTKYSAELTKVNTSLMEENKKLTKELERIKKSIVYRIARKIKQKTSHYLSR